MTTPLQKKRCAIYTRKSTEEGLDMEFNSLDAQREACDAYIASQKHEGWVHVPDIYDDGGFTGGNMERPALKRLINDIKHKKIDTVVVYKVDRLSRSLSDFSKLIDLFDEHNVSFVSVTQQFNTTTSMGRLTLNILLSFAQFEREVIGERIRDKFAASKRKGMWMGGVTPLGYVVKDRHLLIEPTESEAIKQIFERFLMIRSVTTLVRELPKLGIVSKKRTTKTGKIIGGKPLYKASIYKMLTNPIYIGKTKHKDKIYEGRHDAIISQDIWDRVQASLKESPRKRAVKTHERTKGVLCGILKCGGCFSPMSPSHSRKSNGRLYRYYNASNFKRGKCDDCPIKQVSAGEIETVVLNQLQSVFSAPEIILETWRAASKENKDITEYDVKQALGDIFPIWNALFPAEQERLIHLMLEKAVIHPDHVEVCVRADGIDSLVKSLNQQKKRLEEKYE